MKEALVWSGVGGELLPIAKLGICTRWWANWIRLAITEYCGITWYHLERGLWVKDFYSCKLMTQSILVNSTRRTLKAKNSTSFNWCLSWCKSAHLKWCGMNLTENLQLNNPQVQLTSGNWQESWVGQTSVYLQSLVKRI